MAQTRNARAASDPAPSGAPVAIEPAPNAEPVAAAPSAAVLDTRILPAIERVWDTGVLVFGCFTLLVHLFVFGLAGTFGALRWVVLALLPLTYLAYRVTRPITASTEPAAEASPPLPRVDRAGHMLLACGVVLSFPLTENYFVFWIAALLFFAVMYVRSAAAHEPLSHATLAGRREVAWLVLLAGVAMVLTAISHRPDTDDGFLINVPVWMLDNPGKVLYSEDGMHNLPGVPIVFPTYRAHTIEVLYGWLAWLLHLEPIVVAHILLPPLSAALAVLSSALLLRVLLPRGWLLATTALIVFWAAMGDVHEGFANHAYVRIFQGKAVMVTALLPYLAFAIIRYMESGRFVHWLLVLAAVMCASGLSATGLFVAPLALGAAAVACWKPTRSSTARLFATLGCASYALGIALLMRSQIVDKLDILNGDALYGYVKTFPASFVQILGVGPYMFLHVLGVLGAAALAPDRARRRWLAALGLVYFALVMNPLLYDLWVKYVTSAPVAWRIWWMVPVPVLVAMMLAAPFSTPSEERKRTPRLALFALTVLATFAVVPKVWSLSAQNNVTFDWPRLKVPPAAYALAGTVQRLTPPGYSVLAPRELAMWITTRRGHPRMVAHKENTLKVMEPYMGPEQFGLRMHMFMYIMGAGRSPRSPEVLAYAIDKLHIGLVAYEKSLPWASEVDSVMHGAGFARESQRNYVLWYRMQNAAPPASRQ